MSKRYKVIERQIVDVVYYIDADSEEMAAEHVGMLRADEYDSVKDVINTEILEVTEVTDEQD
jgi:hypothetical protein